MSTKSIGHVELVGARQWVVTFPNGSRKSLESRDAAISAVLDAAVERGDIKVTDGAAA